MIAHTFTAYDLTRSLRAAHPRVYIAHESVRESVHQRMTSVVASQYYAMEKVRFPQGDAIRYFPV